MPITNKEMISHYLNIDVKKNNKLLQKAGVLEYNGVVKQYRTIPNTMVAYSRDGQTIGRNFAANTKKTA